MTYKKRSRLSVLWGLAKLYWLSFYLSDFGFWFRRTSKGFLVFFLMTIGFVSGMLMPIAGVAIVLLAISILDKKS
jgi:hypothetical protein